MRRLLVTANVVPSSPIFVTLMMEALSSLETSQITPFFVVTAVKTSDLTHIRLGATLYKSAIHRLVFSVTILTAVLGNVFQR
jgi:hypothetical protein